MEKKELQFKSIFVKDPIVCDECGRTLFPRVDYGFKDLTYGIIVCLNCRDKFLKK